MSKDEQLSTWMDWIWSSMCLELLCTSTQSNNLKWVSGRGINSQWHPKSRWLIATEKGSVGWTDVVFFKASVHPMALPRLLVVEILWHNCSDAIHRRCVGSSNAEDPATKSPLLAFTRPSDRPTLPLDQGVRSSGAEGFVLARLCLDSNWASDRPTVSSLQTVGSFGAAVFAAPPLQLVRRIYKMDRRFIRRCLGFHLVIQLVRRLHRRLLFGYRRFIRWWLFFSFLARFWPLIFSFWHVIFLHPWDLEVSTKTC
jgi:hypothetical protein